MHLARIFAVLLALGHGAFGCGSDSRSSVADSGTPPWESGAPDIGGGETGSTAQCPVLDPSKQSPLSNHQIQRATSADGLRFTPDGKVLLARASVPDGVIGPDDKHWIYFVNGNPGQHAVFVGRVEGDELVTFDCVRIDGAINGNAVDPDVVRLPDGRYRLFYFQGWFVPGEPPPKPGEAHRFYTAISQDGIHFTVENKILETQGGGTDPSAVQLADGSWLMSLTLDDKVVLASSPDAKAFTLTGVEFEPAITELATFDQGQTVRIYLATTQGLKVKVSSDRGKTWTDETTVMGLGPDPSMLRNTDGSWTMYYKTFSAPN